MHDDEVVLSHVKLSRVLQAHAKDRHNNLTRLYTVGEAARFIQLHFSTRTEDGVWTHAEHSLRKAAETGDADQAAHATEAVVVLLEAEGMLFGPTGV